MFANPQIACIVADNMFRSKLRNIRECQTCKGRHEENITDNLQTLATGFTFVDTVTFLDCEEVRLSRHLLELDADKWIFLYLVVGNTAVGYLFQSLHIADEGILAKVFLRFEEHLVSSDYLACKLR